MSGMLVPLAPDESITRRADEDWQRWPTRWERAVVGREFYTGLVHSLEVERDHNYVADGIVTHNCHTYAVETAEGGKRRTARERGHRGVRDRPCARPDRAASVTDTATLNDLVTFARLEVAANEIEPWAAVLAELARSGDLDPESALWAVKLYNAYDDFGSAFRVYADCPDVQAWPAADPAVAVAQSLSQERRSLRGGRIVRHLDSYVGLLDRRTQTEWLTGGLPVSGDPFVGFGVLDAQLRRVWGVGRQTSFEWAEFAAKVAALPVETTDGALWESSGPRESIERIYEADWPTVGWLNDRAGECKATLAAEGVDLSWWDFETVICDFNVMRKGRYYVGQHLAMIREEIDGLDGPAREMLDRAYAAVIPEPWATGVKAGVDKELRRRYRDTRQIVIPMEEAA